jgi:peptidoglycan hydrolase-like protein with peptidoglycan-binding domain
MSDTGQANGTQVDEQEPTAGDFRKRMEAAQEEAKEAKEALATLQREQAFTKAGIPETGAGALVRKAYDGEATPEAIKAFAEEHGITAEGEAAATATDVLTAADATQAAAAGLDSGAIAASAARAAATAGAQATQAATAGGGAGAPAVPSLVDQINAATSKEEVQALMGQNGLLEPVE